MLCIGGPASGIQVKLKDSPMGSSFNFFHGPIEDEPRLSDFLYPTSPQDFSFSMNIHRYRYEVVEHHWHQCGRFQCVALVHDSVTDRGHIRRCVLAAFFTQLIDLLERNNEPRQV